MLGTGKTLNDPSVQNYLRWARNAYNYNTNVRPDGWPPAYFYYLWSSSKAYEIMQQSGVPAAPGNLRPSDLGTLPQPANCALVRTVNRDPAVDPRPPTRGAGGAGYYAGTVEKGWYYDYAYRLMGLQTAGGQFPNPNGSWNVAVDHAYALLVLLRSTGGICVDSDGDGICDAEDNCPANSNPAQEDTDGDGVGNACDNCPTTANPDQADSNSNGIGDACEVTKCDLDKDGDIDKLDISAILRYRGKTVPPAPTEADLDNNRFININDSRGCTLRCTRPSCATQ
jgi:hypothetical protein